MIFTTLLLAAALQEPLERAALDRPIPDDVRGRSTYEEARYPLFGRVVAGAGDVDADGTPDLLVADTGGWRPGHKGERAAVFALSGKDGATLHVVLADRPGQVLGRSLRTAGDVDGDGHADWIAGSPDESGETPGHAIVVSGERGDELYRLRGEAKGDLFGWDVDGAGDVDGDGRADFVVAARDAGCVYLYSGATGELLHRIPGGASGMFGYRVRGAGDVDADGHDDVIVVRAYADGGLGHELSVRSGLDGAPIASVLSRNQTEPPAIVPLVDGDGARAMLVGLKCGVERVNLPSGQVQPLYSVRAGVPASANGDGASTDPRDARERGASDVTDACGILHAALGDLDGDGVAEVLVGVPTSSVGGGGRIEVRSGRSGVSLLRVDGAALEAGDFGAVNGFGITADAVGDVDGDGTVDFVVGCDHREARWPGRAWLLSGRDGSVLRSFRRVGGTVVVE